MGYATLLQEEKGRVALLTLNRPGVLNALSPQVYEELGEAAREIAAGRKFKAVILTGSGEKAFAAGADIAAMSKMSPEEAREFAALALEVQLKLENLPLPVIAAVNGLALGGGCELALACDLRLAASHARFGQPEINLALIPGGGGTQRLSLLLGEARAKELIFTGRLIGAEEALGMGLVNAVYPRESLLEEALKLATRIAEKSGPALAMAKAAINWRCNLLLRQGLEYEVSCFSRCFAREDLKEGIAAFLEKRPPLFQDR